MINEQEIGGLVPDMNAGFVRRLRLLDRDNVVHVLDPVRFPESKLGGNNTGIGLVLKEDATLLLPQVLPRSVRFSESVSINEQGVAFESVFLLELPKPDPATLNWLLANEQREFVIIWEDYNDQSWVSGNEELGFRIQRSRSVAGLNVLLLSFSARLPLPSFALPGYELIDFLQNHYFSTYMSMYKYKTINILEVRRGDTFEMNFLVTVPSDLTGWTAKSQVKKFASDTVAILELDTEIEGQVVMISKDAASMDLPGDMYCWDIQFTNPEGKVYTLFGGKFEVLNDVTR